MESIKKRLATGAVWVGASRIAINLMGFASTVVLARMLTPDDFGLVAIATSLLAVVMSLTELSLASALVHHKEPSAGHFHSAWTIAFIRAIAVSAVFALAAYPVALIYNDPRLTLVVIVTGLTGAVSGLGNPKTVILARQLVFWPEFIVRVAQKVMILAISIPIAYYYRTYWSIVLGSAVGTFLSVALSYAIVPYLPRLSLQHVRELFKFSIWLSLGQAVNTINWRFDQFLIGYWVGKPELGVYAIADNLSSMPTREATAPFAQTLFPGFVKLVNDPERLKRGYLLAQSTLCAVALPLGFGFAALAHPVILLVMGPKWLAAVPIVQVLSGTFALGTLSTTLQPLAMATGNTKLLFKRDMQVFAIRVPFIIVGFLTGGLMGIVYARSVSSNLGVLWNMELVRRISGVSLRQQFRANARTLLCVALMVAALVIVEHYLAFPEDRWGLLSEIVLLAILGGAVYLISLLAVWWASGRPSGPESEVFKIVNRLRHSLLGSKAALP